MDALKDKSKKEYNYTSRYATFYYYYNTLDNKYMYGLTNNLSDTTEATRHMLKYEDTLDSLSFKYYGRPDLYWVIADYNRIQDPYTKLSDRFVYLDIPSLGQIRYKN